MNSAVVAPLSPLHAFFHSLRSADPRLLSLIRALAFAMIAMSLAAATLPCSTKVTVLNEGLDQATLLLFVMLLVAGLTGRRALP